MWTKSVEPCSAAVPEVTRYRYTGSGKLEVELIDIGASIAAIRIPGKDGVVRDVILGYENVADYLDNPNCLGCTVGRVANRIKDGHFTFDGKEYQMERNNNGNLLHSGSGSYHKRRWNSRIDGDAVEFTMDSPDGDGGFPGHFQVTLRYRVVNDETLELVYEGGTDAPTIVNMTNHSYFNLNGHNSGAIIGHELMIRAAERTEVIELIPTGKFIPVAGSAFDLNEYRPFTESVKELPHGFDDNFVLSHDREIDAGAFCPESGIRMTCKTTEPGMQLYTAYFLGDAVGKDGYEYGSFGGFCLEAQHYPDSPNHPEFPSVVLRPGERYRQVTSYTFTVEK